MFTSVQKRYEFVGVAERENVEFTGTERLLAYSGLGQIRSGQLWGAWAGAARRRVHLATVLLPLPYGHRPGRRQARLGEFLQALDIYSIAYASKKKKVA